MNAKELQDTADRLGTYYRREDAQCSPVLILADANIIANAVLTAWPLADWHEDIGPALWWKFPIIEPPYAGTPHCSDWPGYHTHWTPIVCPKEMV